MEYMVLIRTKLLKWSSFYTKRSLDDQFKMIFFGVSAGAIHVVLSEKCIGQL